MKIIDTLKDKSQSNCVWSRSLRWQSITKTYRLGSFNLNLHLRQAVFLIHLV